MKLRLFGIGTIIVIAAWVCIGQSRLDTKLGIVNSISSTEACLAIQNKALKNQKRIAVVLLDKPQSAHSATILRKVEKTCSSRIDVFDKDSSFYLLKMRNADNVWVGIGIVDPGKIAIISGTASSDLNGDGRKEYFRSCTSTEGVHLTIWTGKPLTGNRIWHQYYYLGYDTEPTCRKKDYEGTAQ